MVDQTKQKHGGIGYVHRTSNPIQFRDKVTGKRGWMCAMVAPECRFCYAASINKRWGNGYDFTVPNVDKVEFYLDEKELKRWLNLQKQIENGKVPTPCRLFPFDMTDWFGGWVPFAWLDTIFAYMAMCPDITFVCLTKRPQMALEYFDSLDVLAVKQQSRAARGQVFNPFDVINIRWMDNSGLMPKRSPLPISSWPLRNVHFGVSAGTTISALKMVPVLRKIPAYRHWVSVEPMLDNCEDKESGQSAILCGSGAPIDQIVIGGESGASFRPMQMEWAVNLAEQCREQGISVWMKQSSGFPPMKELDQFPESLRVREWVL